MKTIKNLLFTSIATMGAFMLCGTVFEIYEPFAASVVFSLIYAVIGVCQTESTDNITTAGAVFLTSFALFALAWFVNKELTSFYYSQDWDGCEWSPELANFTWNWLAQIPISVFLAFFTWKYADKFRNELDKEDAERNA